MQATYRVERSASLALFAVLVFAIAFPGIALDLSGRTDTGYRLDWGSDSMVNRVFNNHSLELGISEGFGFSMYGGLQAAMRGTDAGLPYTGLLEAENDAKSRWVDYSLFLADLHYSTTFFGLSFGRKVSNELGAAPYDGLSAWVAPLPGFRVEAYGGIPWNDPSLLRIGTSISGALSAGALEAGAKLSAGFLDEALQVSLGYLYSAQTKFNSSQIGAASSTVKNQLLDASGSMYLGDWLSAGAKVSLIDWNPLPVNAGVWADGLVEAAHLNYTANASVQAIDITVFGQSFSSFYTLLGASHPYVSVACNLSEEVSAFLPPSTLLKSATFDVAYEHRQPLLSSDGSRFNTAYDEFRLGPAFAFGPGLSLSGYYSLLLTDKSKSMDNTINSFGGEIREKIGAFDIRLGTAFTANKWQADYATQTISDEFAAQDYYLKGAWKVSKALDLSLRAYWETALLASISSSTAVNTDALTPAFAILASDPNGAARNSLRVEIRAGYRY
ncbi:MAG: hypothetical protein WCL50_07985 [Spirochaetota bacterium]